MPQDNSDSATNLKHLAIICDGNRRWAKARGLDPWEGHKAGADNIEGILKFCQKQNIKYVTFWIFSTENWKRDPKEVAFLMELFKKLLKDQAKTVLENKVRFTHLGRKDRFSKDIAQALNKLEKDSNHFTEWHLQLAIDYGGRDEILRSINKIVEDAKSGKLTEPITDTIFAKYLDTKDIPDPDLIIRTSGEYRTSGFMPYQGTYAEWEFSPVMFPDLNEAELSRIIEGFNARSRRFGK